MSTNAATPAAATTAASAPASAAPPTDTTDAAIAKALADESDASGEDEGSADPKTSKGADGAEGDEADGSADKVKPATVKLDGAKLVAAIEAKDLPALLEAMGPAAEELLTSKAHATLRLQVKDAVKAQRDAKAAKAEADGLVARLHEKYGDPIKVRQAIEKNEAGALDAFIDLVERQTGADWNACMRWVNAGLAGRSERLQKKATDAAAQTRQQSAQQAQALADTKAWIADGVKKADAKLAEIPEVVDLVLAEIKSGLAKGVDTPAKALPLVKAKLKAQYERLQGLFGTAGDGTRRSQSPSTKARRGENGQFSKVSPNRTIDEAVTDFLTQEGLS